MPRKKIYPKELEKGTGKVAVGEMMFWKLPEGALLSLGTTCKSKSNSWSSTLETERQEEGLEEE